jgi:hypothetical protein
MRKYAVLLISLFLLILATVWLSAAISCKLNLYKTIKEETAESMSFQNRILNAWEWLPGNTIGQEKRERWEEKETEAADVYGYVNRYTIYLILVLTIFIVLNVVVYQHKPYKYSIYGLIMVFSSFACLYLGLQAPFIEIFAYSKDFTVQFPIEVNLNNYPLIKYLDLQELGEIKYDFKETFEGRVYYMYQNKSILELVSILYTGGSYLVAILLMLFSVIFPLIKGITSIKLLFFPNGKNVVKTYEKIMNLGKWSMADVFVSAIFLALFAYSNFSVGVNTGSSTLIGTYYFLAFVVMSIGAGYYIQKAINYESIKNQQNG